MQLLAISVSLCMDANKTSNCFRNFKLFPIKKYQTKVKMSSVDQFLDKLTSKLFVLVTLNILKEIGLALSQT